MKNMQPFRSRQYQSPHQPLLNLAPTLIQCSSLAVSVRVNDVNREIQE